IVLVLYAIISGEQVSAMLLAGFLPGVLSVAVFSFLVMFRSVRAVTPVPVAAGVGRASGGVATEPADSPDAKAAGSVTVTGMGALLRVALVFTIVIGGLYTGFFTASEASALG